MRSSLTTIERKKIFDEVRRLKQSNWDLNLHTLMRALSARFPRLPSRETLKRYLTGVTSPTTSMNEFEPNPSEELSFFLGAWLGDGWADKSDGGKRLLLKVRSREFAEEFARSATKILSKTEPYKVREITDETGKWYLVKATSLKLYEFVTQPFEKLTSCIEAHPIGFLRSFFTAEGNPTISVVQQKVAWKLTVDVCVSCTDSEYLKLVRRLLEGLGYHPTNITTAGKIGTWTNLSIRKKTEWQFRVLRPEEVREFAVRIGFADAQKQTKLEDAFDVLDNSKEVDVIPKWRERYQKERGVWVKKLRGHATAS